MSIELLFHFWSMSLGIPDGLLQSICYVESNHRVGVIAHYDGGSPSYGICQVKRVVFRQLGMADKVSDMMDPKYNIEAAARYLVWQKNRYMSWTKAIVAYNKGKWGGTLTRYHTKVMRTWILKTYLNQ